MGSVDNPELASSFLKMKSFFLVALLAIIGLAVFVQGKDVYCECDSATSDSAYWCLEGESPKTMEVTTGSCDTGKSCDSSQSYGEWNGQGNLDEMCKSTQTKSVLE